jgi:hypothetical protein
MKGFIPVTKDSLLSMLAECREEVANDVADETRGYIDRFIKQEQARITSRRWYRLWMLPAARFAFDDESVKAYANTIDYPMFEGSPFKGIESDAKNSLEWIARLERVAMSEHSGEPIQIDINTFMRISEPARCYWARARGFYCSIRS